MAFLYGGRSAAAKVSPREAQMSWIARSGVAIAIAGIARLAVTGPALADTGNFGQLRRLPGLLNSPTATTSRLCPSIAKRC